MKFKLSHFGLIAILMTTFASQSFAEMPTRLFGYKLGETCKDTQFLKDEEKENKIYCAASIKQIASIDVYFKSLSYDEVLQKTINNIGVQPTSQTPNKKVIGCDQTLYKAMFGDQATFNVDPETYHYSGQAEWTSVEETSVKGEPKVEFRIWTNSNFGCSSDAFSSLISLTSNQLWEVDHQTSLQNEKAKTNNTLNKLFN
jgi:hypothetical protein